MLRERRIRLRASSHLGRPGCDRGRVRCEPMVDFLLTDENRLVQQSARAFAENEILPHIREWDEKGEVHREVFDRMGELGFLGAPIPEQYGGAGVDYISFAVPCEGTERADTAVPVLHSV